MDTDILLTPAGRLLPDRGRETTPTDESGDATGSAHAAASSIESAFDESSAAGLIDLVASSGDALLSPTVVFWRKFAQLYFHRLCEHSEEELTTRVAKPESHRLPPPDSSMLDSLIESAPPMRGLEYLTADVLCGLWEQLDALTLARAGDGKAGPIAYLQSVNPWWHLLGRVTFHLAENKRDPQRPFAFLATYAHRVSARAKLQHLPLAQALKQYAGQRDQDRLAKLLEPVRRAADESLLVRELLDSRAMFQPQAWMIRDAHRFLVDVPLMERSGIVVRVPDWWKARQQNRPEVKVRIGNAQASRVGVDGLLDFSINVALGGEPLSEEELQQILETTDGLALLRGKWVEVDREKLAQALDHWKRVAAEHPDGVDFIQGMRLLAGVRLEHDADAEDVSGWTRVTAGDWLNETLSQLRDPQGLVDCEPGRELRATLRPYQADGVRWLWFMTRLGLGACLADDMGLGKTIQVIDLLLLLKRESPPGADVLAKPSMSKQATVSETAGAETSAALTTADRAARTSLLVVPASLVGNWKSELERFAPTLRVFYAHRSETDVETLTRIAKQPAAFLRDYDVVVSTYGLVRRTAWFAKHRWKLVVLDEAQAIKNASSAQAKAVCKLESSGRIALSGTPVENHLGELWALFDFCCPGLLGNANQFKRYVTAISRQQDRGGYRELRQLVRPYILRRMKTDPGIVPDLPDKTEIRTECGLSKKQIVLYENTLTELARRLKETDGMQRRGMVLSTLMQLKQICNHASQFLGLDEYEPADSGKFQRLQQICQPIIERQERALIFTQFQSLTEPLARYLTHVFGRPGLVLHGGVAVKKRKKLVDAFQQDNGPPFFVISVKAGGTGLNLTAASHVVHFDRWWNPAVENQATDRAFRIGQHRNVLVHKFVCRGTVEERIDEMIREKQELADEILSGGAETILTEMKDDELLNFVAIDLSRTSVDD